MKRVFKTALWAQDMITDSPEMVKRESENLNTWQKECEGKEVVNNLIPMESGFGIYFICYEWTEEEESK